MKVTKLGGLFIFSLFIFSALLIAFELLRNWSTSLFLIEVWIFLYSVFLLDGIFHME
ncbi:MAG: hypothetical protein QIT35_gp83 [Methanophagales virus PBV299]|uniref:Uncharacterized protein n=1 Tax=Methanophagales virus PBV299 TaxID=2987730 RepID=A0ABY6GLJ4_9CAUD|nr:MAG: hypothetical protein QIT35_gp83 [Methanophagales virus PBV299]UYL64879.1 MAG: hypothetical protein OFDIEDLO_00083 [Methanophagales virus PBV299]